MPYRLIYSSVSSTPMQRDELDDLLEAAQGHNEVEGITGALVYVDGHFLQVLEGERATVEDLMRRIAKDLRHETVAVLQAGEVPAAAFPDWHMAYVSATAEQVSQWAGLGSTRRLPEVWDSLRHNAESTARVTEQILAILAEDTPS